LAKATLYRLSVSLIRVELLERLFPDGLEAPPRVNDSAGQSYVLNALSQGYRFSGSLREAVSSLRLADEIDKREHDLAGRCVGLINLSECFWLFGDLRTAETAVRTAFVIAHQEDSSFYKGACLAGIGLVTGTRGASTEATAILLESMRILAERFAQQPLCVINVRLGELDLWKGDPSSALSRALRAWDLAGLRRNERDFIRVARVHGSAALYLGDFETAGERLHNALVRARAVSLIEEELPAIVALAEWYRQQNELTRARAVLEDVWDAAERGPYRLFHADALNVLTQIELDAGNTIAAIEAATEAYRLAWCDGPPFAYHWGLEKARAHLTALGAPEPEMPPFDESRHEPMPEVEINPPDEFGGEE
jgi:tetratricopeptide (TPR) repeat protein